MLSFGTGRTVEIFPLKYRKTEKSLCLCGPVALNALPPD